MKNKLLTITLIILVAITLVGVIAIIAINQLNSSSDKEPSIDDIIEASVEIPEITTNLAGNDYIKIAFMIQTDGKKAKSELEKRSFQVNNIIIGELSEMKAEELTGKAGKEKLQNAIKQSTNELMQEGQVEQVYITSSILQ